MKLGEGNWDPGTEFIRRRYISNGTNWYDADGHRPKPQGAYTSAGPRRVRSRAVPGAARQTSARSARRRPVPGGPLSYDEFEGPGTPGPYWLLPGATGPAARTPRRANGRSRYTGPGRSPRARIQQGATVRGRARASPSLLSGGCCCWTRPNARLSACIRWQTRATATRACVHAKSDAELIAVRPVLIATT